MHFMWWIPPHIIRTLCFLCCLFLWTTPTRTFWSRTDGVVLSGFFCSVPCLTDLCTLNDPVSKTSSSQGFTLRTLERFISFHRLTLPRDVESYEPLVISLVLQWFEQALFSRYPQTLGFSAASVDADRTDKEILQKLLKRLPVSSSQGKMVMGRELIQ